MLKLEFGWWFIICCHNTRMIKLVFWRQGLQSGARSVVLAFILEPKLLLRRQEGLKQVRCMQHQQQKTQHNKPAKTVLLASLLQDTCAQMLSNRWVARMCQKYCFGRCMFQSKCVDSSFGLYDLVHKHAQTIVLAPSLQKDDAKTRVVAGQLESFVFSTHQGSQSGAQSVGLAAKLALKLLLRQKGCSKQVH